MGRVQTAGEAMSRPLSPSRLPLRAHFHRERERDVWVRGRIGIAIISSFSGHQALFVFYLNQVYVYDSSLEFARHSSVHNTLHHAKK